MKKVVEVVDKKQMGIKDGLNELNDTVRAHQLKLENDLKAKQQSLEEGEQQRLDAEKKLQELQQVRNLRSQLMTWKTSKQSRRKDIKNVCGLCVAFSVSWVLAAEPLVVAKPRMSF